MARYCGSCGGDLAGEQKFCTECGAAVGSTLASSSSENALKASEPDVSPAPPVPNVKPKKSNPVGLFIAWSGVAFLYSPVIILLFIMLSSAFGGGADDDEPPADNSQQTAQVQQRPSDLSATECLTVEGNVMAVEYNFSQGEATPSHVVMVLETTATDFEEIASLHSGSERDWLLKMAELSNSLGDFIESGAGDGDLIFDQLMNNYALVKQFCG